MSEKERILDVLHFGEYPVYEVVEKGSGGDIVIRHVRTPGDSITLIRSTLPHLIESLSRIPV